MKKVTMSMILIVLVAFGISGFAQKTNLLIMKTDAVSYETSVSEIYRIVFQDPSGTIAQLPAEQRSNNALMVENKDGSSSGKIPIDDIKQLEFSETELTIVPFEGTNTVFNLDDIDKLLLNDGLTGINLLKAQSGIKVYLTAGGDAIVESAAAIQSLTVVSITGATLIREQFPNSGKTSSRINMRSFPAGMYIVNVETLEGTTAKKLTIKN